MIYKEYNMDVDIIRGAKGASKFIKISFNKNDYNSAKIKFTITHNNSPIDLTDAQVMLGVQKVNNTVAFQECSIVDISAGKVEVILTTQTLSMAGIITAELFIDYGTSSLSTPKFEILINDAIMDDDTLVSVNEFPVIQKAIDAAEILGDIDLNIIVNNTNELNTVKTDLAQKATKATTGVSRKVRKKVLPPAAFTWQDAPINIYKNLIGEFSTDFDVSIFQHVGAGKTYYVDFKNGLDTNDGLSQATALKTLAAAEAKSDVDIILVASGLIDATGLFSTGKYITKNLTIKALPGADVTLSVHAVLTWTLSAGMTYTYQTNRTALGRVFDAKFIDNDGDYKELTKVNSIAEVEATPNSYYWASNILYVRTFDDRVPDDRIRGYLNDRNAFRYSGNGKLYLEGLKIHGGLAPLHVENSPTNLYPEIYAKNCEFKYPTGTNTVNVRAAKLCYFQNCVAARGIDDGFNYHKLNEVVPNVIEVNCIGRDNGTDSDTDNGSTMHEGGKIIRVNGQYYRNKGSNVGDINWNTQSWNPGCAGFDSRASAQDRYKSNFTAHENAQMWLDGCVSYDSLNAVVAQINAFIYKRDCVFEGAEFLEDTGKILEY